MSQETGSTRGQTRRRVQELLAARGIRPSKSLGQCFLIDLNLLGLLVQHAELDGTELVLEVGTGTGSLSELLADGARVLVTVEIDPRLYDLARRDVLATRANVLVLCTDALQGKHRIHPLLTAAVDVCYRRYDCSTRKLVANLPYSIATPFILNLLYAEAERWQRFVVTVQRELAEKMAAGPSDPDYGAVSVLVQAVAQVRILRRLSRSVFWPKPDVQSAMLLIEPAQERYGRIADREAFRRFVHRLWAGRRKQLATACRELLGIHDAAERLKAIGFDPQQRVERLAVVQFVELFLRGIGNE